MVKESLIKIINNISLSSNICGILDLTSFEMLITKKDIIKDSDNVINGTSLIIENEIRLIEYASNGARLQPMAETPYTENSHVY